MFVSYGLFSVMFAYKEFHFHSRELHPKAHISFGVKRGWLRLRRSWRDRNAAVYCTYNNSCAATHQLHVVWQISQQVSENKIMRKIRYKRGIECKKRSAKNVFEILNTYLNINLLKWQFLGFFFISTLHMFLLHIL